MMLHAVQAHCDLLSALQPSTSSKDQLRAKAIKAARSSTLPSKAAINDWLAPRHTVQECNMRQIVRQMQNLVDNLADAVTQVDSTVVEQTQINSDWTAKDLELSAEEEGTDSCSFVTAYEEGSPLSDIRPDTSTEESEDASLQSSSADDDAKEKEEEEEEDLSTFKESRTLSIAVKAFPSFVSPFEPDVPFDQSTSRSQRRPRMSEMEFVDNDDADRCYKFDLDNVDEFKELMEAVAKDPKLHDNANRLQAFQTLNKAFNDRTMKLSHKKLSCLMAQVIADVYLSPVLAQRIVDSLRRKQLLSFEQVEQIRESLHLNISHQKQPQQQQVKKMVTVRQFVLLLDKFVKKGKQPGQFVVIESDYY